MISVEEIVRLWIRRLWDEHAIEVFDDMLSPDGRTFGNEQGAQPVSQEAFCQQHEAIFLAFPDIKSRILEVIIQGDRVAVLFAALGSHANKFWGVPATGRRIEFDVMTFFTVKGGVLVEVRQMIDYRRLLQQIGVK